MTTPALAYENTEFVIPPGYTNPISAPIAGGCQQAASASVIGYDANVTGTLTFQGIGLDPVLGGFLPWDGDIP